VEVGRVLVYCARVKGSISEAIKAKAVPLHAMKALGGERSIAPTRSRTWH
jgi:hypothetical protein